MINTNYTPSGLYQAAQAWLARGASLIPVRHNSKYNLAGFGPNRARITDPDTAWRYFGVDGFNLGVCLGANTFCLDFDDPGLASQWEAVTPSELLITHLEASPRGWHYFYAGKVPAGIRLVAGAEIKRTVIVAPSQVAGRRYVNITPNDGDSILEVSNVEKLLFSLLSKEKLSNPRQPGQPTSKATMPPGDDLISKIKARWPMLLVASGFTELRPSPAGQERWYTGKCPLHDDQHPSFWLDAERGLWGCFSPACQGYAGEGFGGHDVINLVALVHGIDNQAAIKRLAIGVKP